MNVPIRLQPQFLLHLVQMTGSAIGFDASRAILETSDQWFFNPNAPVALATIRVENQKQRITEGLFGVAFSPNMRRALEGQSDQTIQRMAEILFVRFAKHLSGCLNLTVNFQPLPVISGGKMETPGYSFTLPFGDRGNIQWLFLDGFLPPDLPPQHQVKEMVV